MKILSQKISGDTYLKYFDNEKFEIGEIVSLMSGFHLGVGRVTAYTKFKHNGKCSSGIVHKIYDNSYADIITGNCELELSNGEYEQFFTYEKGMYLTYNAGLFRPVFNFPVPQPKVGEVLEVGESNMKILFTSKYA